MLVVRSKDPSYSTAFATNIFNTRSIKYNPTVSFGHHGSQPMVFHSPNYIRTEYRKQINYKLSQHCGKAHAIYGMAFTHAVKILL